MMILRKTIFALVVLIASPSKEIVLHHAGDSVSLGSLNFTITTQLKPNELPVVSLIVPNGETALSFAIGKSEPELFKVPDEEGAPGPIVQVFMIKGAVRIPDVLVPITMVGGGSDCGYDATVVGMTQGHLKEWLPAHAFVNSQGGFYVGDLGAGRGYGLAAWNFIWEDGAHYGPHRYEVNLYRFQPETGRALRIAHLESRRKHDTDEEALHELGFTYKNLLRSDSSFGC
ncbi:MAG TPA: hypothetical protein VF214_02250 [Edaphobacter sp.]